MPSHDPTGSGRPGALFRPLRIRSMELENRLVLPPMTTLLAGAEGEIPERLIAFYVARARGGVGLITTETAEVHPYTHGLSLGDRGFTAIYDDRFIPGFRRLTDRIHAAGAKVSVQLHHPGNAMIMLDPARPPVAPSATAYPGGAPPRALSVEEIGEIVEAFGAGARRAREAGFDAVDIHGGHGYLIAQFLSPFFNRRADRYGGDLRGRAAFATEVLRAVRRNVGDDFPVIFRMSADERVPGGRTVDESVVLAPLLVAAGADCLSITTGMQFTLLYTVPAMGMPRGLNVAAAAAIKAAVDVPVMVAGRLNDPVLAESVVASGRADLIAIGRGLVADPDLPRKLESGAWQTVRPCISCNQGCIGGLIAGFPFTCLVNPEAGRESEGLLAPAARPKRVLVAGGGPAGLEAARVAAARGHAVTLAERSSTLGGQFLLAALPPRKEDILPFLRYAEAEVHALGVTVSRGQAVTVAQVAEMQPDAVIVATGSEPLLPDIPGIAMGHVVTAHDVLCGAVPPGRRVVVIGGGQVGCETAELLDRYAEQVTVVELRAELAPDVAQVPRAALLHALAQTRVRTMTATRVVEITAEGVVVERDGARETLRGIESVVVAAGVRPVRQLADDLAEIVPELHVIGDARGGGSALDAIAAGFEVGRRI
ncbi:MAG: FAD-dependent oxidoreductase [Candidatus Binatia bacterium]